MVKNFMTFRFRCYLTRHGLVRTIRRSLELVWRSIFHRRRLLFYVDLTKSLGEDFILPQEAKVECKNCRDEISEEELNSLVFYRRERIIKHQLEDRFAKGARLWLIKLNGCVAGMVWSVRQTTVEPYYFPLTDGDVHFFDNEVFREYRGRSINSHLINYVLHSLKEEGMVRAYIETAMSNVSEIRSLAKTYFRNYGSATKLHIFGSNISFWSKAGEIGSL